MKALIDAAFSRSRTVLLALAVILVAGASAYFTIPKESSPDVNIPMMYVHMTHDGISPEDAERLLIKPMERELRAIEGLKEMHAVATEGSASVTLEFEAGFDPDRALEDVRTQVDRARTELPEETNEPVVNEINVALFPVLVINLYGDVPERALVASARDLKDRLEALPGVLEVDVGGDREEMVEINVDPLLMESYRLSMQDMANFIRQNNQLVPAGVLDTGEGRFPVKVPGVIDNLDELLNLAIKRGGDRVVRLKDVASVRRTFKDPQGYARLNGQPSLSLEVTKRIGANVIKTIDAVRAEVKAARQSLPSSVRVSYSQDRSEDIKRMLSDLQNNVLSGIILVMIVIVGALGLRAGTLVGISIPGSFLLGILAIDFMGLTVNVVVLFGLILALGLLVDGAIVVVELADRYLAEGLARKEAYRRAAHRMAWPVIASTATTLAAFAPLLAWPGVIGEFMRYLPITLIAVLTASLAMALVFVPNLGGVIGGAAGGAQGLPLQDRPATGFTGAYVALLRTLSRHAGKVVLVAVVLLVAAYALYARFGKGVEFFPDIEPDNAVVQVHTRGDFSVSERDRLVREVEQRLVGMDDFESVYARSATQFRTDVGNDTVGLIQLEFKDWQERRPAAEALAEVRARTRDIPGVKVEVQKQESGPTDAKPVEVQIASNDPQAMNATVKALRTGMRKVGGFVDVSDDRPKPGLEWRLKVDRAEASRYGANVALLGQAVQLVTQGIKMGEYRTIDADDELDIRVRYPSAHRNLDELEALRVQTPQGLVPIGNFVTRVPAQKVDSIRRVDGRRAVTLQADVAPDVLVASQIERLRTWMANAGVERPGVRVSFKGQDEDIKDSERFLSGALAAALALMAVILVTQFNSFYQSFLILSAVAFSTAGVVLGLLIAGKPFGVVMSGIGVIALAGIVVNNNIVLIDTYNRLRADGLDAIEAVIHTGAQRLRPVLLTTATTILGLMPMVLQMNVDIVAREITFGAPSTQWWVQLSTAVVGGLAFATVLTLILTPCLLILGARVSARLQRHRPARARHPQPAQSL